MAYTETLTLFISNWDGGYNEDEIIYNLNSNLYIYIVINFLLLAKIYSCNGW